MNFIPEFEDSDHTVIFLDLKITRTTSGLVTSFYRKETHSGTYLHFTSHAPIVQKINIIKNEARRITNNCTYPEDAEPHLSLLKTNLLKCGYPLAFIQKYMLEAKTNSPRSSYNLDPKTPRLCIPYISEAYTRFVRKEVKKAGIEAVVIVKSDKNLKKQFHKAPSITPCKCKICYQGIPCTTRHVMYNAECIECRKSYIGVTTRPFAIRLAEHNSSIKNNTDKSALTPHLEECTNPLQSTEGFIWTTLDRGKGWKDSFIREGVLINTMNPKINRNTTAWA